MCTTQLSVTDSAGNDVILKIEFVICRDKEAGGGGQNGA